MSEEDIQPHAPLGIWSLKGTRENRIICPTSNAIGQMIRPSEWIAVALGA